MQRPLPSRVAAALSALTLLSLPGLSAADPEPSAAAATTASEEDRLAVWPIFSQALLDGFYKGGGLQPSKSVTGCMSREFDKAMARPQRLAVVDALSAQQAPTDLVMDPLLMTAARCGPLADAFLAGFNKERVIAGPKAQKCLRKKMKKNPKPWVELTMAGAGAGGIPPELATRSLGLLAGCLSKDEMALLSSTSPSP